MRHKEYMKILTEKDGYWYRVCPKCEKKIKHKSYASARDSHRQQRLCCRCANDIPRVFTIETRQAMSNSHKGKATWNKGLTKETNKILLSMSNKRQGFTHSIESRKKISDSSKMHWENPEYARKVKDGVKANRSVEKWRNTMESLGYFTPLENRSDVKRYYILVWRFTRKNDLTKLLNYSQLHGRNGIEGAWQLDHKYSISEGYRNNIPPEIIGSIHNLEYISAIKNNKKKHRCSISKEILMELYYGIKKS